MLKRKVDILLEEWKAKADRKPLVLKGCRQCGKTYAVRSFAQTHYKNEVYINFFANPEYAQIFKGSLKVDDLIMYMSALPDLACDFSPENTVIILDEIQECAEARTSLKFWAMDGRFDVISTGSLLGMAGYKEPVSVPVGYEEIVTMYPLDFEEFLWANGINDNIILSLRNAMDKASPVPEVIHSRMRELFYQYAVVGGMPAVVQNFIEHRNLSTVLTMQRNILEEYKEDMVKYASASEKAVIKQCFESIPKQLAKENKKFQYSLIKKGSTAARYLGSLQWIEDAGVIVRCHNLNITELPLEGNAIEEIFKVYMADTGLFIAMLEDGTQADVLQGNLHAYKGAVFENLIADIFTKMQRKLYYYHKDSGLEIDFVTRYKGECTLIEVKASTGNTKSSKTILNHPEKYHVNSCIKLGDYNVGKEDQTLTLPSYMAFLLKEKN